jgi:hypothetical protein
MSPPLGGLLFCFYLVKVDLPSLFQPQKPATKNQGNDRLSVALLLRYHIPSIALSGDR